MVFLPLALCGGSLVLFFVIGKIQLCCFVRHSKQLSRNAEGAPLISSLSSALKSQQMIDQHKAADVLKRINLTTRDIALAKGGETTTNFAPSASSRGAALSRSKVVPVNSHSSAPEGGVSNPPSQTEQAPVPTDTSNTTALFTQRYLVPELEVNVSERKELQPTSGLESPEISATSSEDKPTLTAIPTMAQLLPRIPLNSFARAVRSAVTKRILDNSLLACGVVMFLFIPTATKACLKLLSCQTLDDDNLYLVEDLDLLCWTGHHMTWAAVLALPGLFGYAFVFPLLGFVQLLRVHCSGELYLPRSRGKYQAGFLAAGFRKGYFYWEFVILARKVRGAVDDHAIACLIVLEWNCERPATPVRSLLS